ncbi:MAG: imidazolonepropionase [Opitutales bacterium]|nr:imidazolonepropionase [Opitutales bacterium]
MKLPLPAFLAVLASSLSAESILYKAAEIHVVSGPVISPGQMLVKDDHIASVGKNLKAPKGTKVVDLGDLNLYPALIAAPTSLGLTEINAVRATRDDREVGDYTADVEAWVAVNPDSELIPVARANGVAHALVIPMGGRISGVSGLVRLHGWGVENMTVDKASALHLWWPGMGLDVRPKEQLSDPSKRKSIDEQDKERHLRITVIDEFFDDAEAYAKAKASKGPGFAVVPAWEALLPVLKQEIPVMIHADETRQIKAAVAWAKRRNYKAILAGGRDAWQVADLLAKEKIPLIYHHVFTLPARDFDPHDVHFRTPGLLVKAGVKLAIGLRPGAWSASNLRNLPYHAAQAAANGLTEEEAIASITLRPAEILGMADRIGSLEAKKEATFIAVEGDLLDLRSQVKHMWIAGEEVSLESRHVRLYEKYRNRPKPN